MRHRCIACGRDAGDQHPRYEWEPVCLSCAAMVNPVRWSIFSHQLRLLRHYRKYDSTPEARYHDLAAQMAKNWSKIREELGVKPEMPAGLARILKEMGW